MKVSVLLLVSFAVFTGPASAAYDPGNVSTGGPIIIGGAEELKCEEIGGECMSKKDKKICKEMEGEIDPMGKCEGKKDICCVLDFVTMPTGGPIFTGEPEELWCEDIGGECMSKKDKKKCNKMEGEIDPMGKCEGKKDICCVTGFATMPTGGPIITGKPEELRCEDIGGECMSKKDKKRCQKDGGVFDPIGICEGKKDICCMFDFATMPTGGPIFTGEPEEMRCEEIDGICLPKKVCKEDGGKFDSMGKCEGQKDICCVLE